MCTPSAYAAGPIHGTTFEEANKWRNEISEALQPDVVVFSPLRGKEFYQPSQYSGTEENHPLLSIDGVIDRDLFDVKMRDLLFVNLLDSYDRVSIGTQQEIGAARVLTKPIVMVIEPDAVLKGTLHEHKWVTHRTFRAPSLEEGVLITRAILLPDPGPVPMGFNLNDYWQS